MSYTINHRTRVRFRFSVIVRVGVKHVLYAYRVESRTIPIPHAYLLIPSEH